MLEGMTIVVGSIFMLLGLAGSILPMLPGPPLSFIGLFLLALIKHFSPPLTPTWVIILAIVTILVIALDYIIPLLGAKRYGASKWGVWGSVLGMAIGLFWSPFAMLVGAFIGAVLVEWSVGKKKGEALRAGWGVVMGTLFATILRLGVSGMMTYYFVLALIR
jgi:uncharacterized protein YqgC (DUF456 family)